MPITSPVDFISGPRMLSTPGSFRKGNTDALTAMCSILASPTSPCCSRVLPSMIFVATFASGIPVAFEIIGTVLEALGFASSM